MKHNQVLLSLKLAAVACAFALAANTYADSDNDHHGDNDHPNFDTNLPTVSILATDPTALEGTSTGAFTLLRFGPTNVAVSVDLAITGTASNGVDYATISTPVIISAGTLAVDLPVTTIVDTNTRGNKTVILTIQTNGTYNVFHRRAKVDIIDDTFDIPPPTVVITSPTNGSTFTNPVSIVITADAEDETGIQSVTFFANDDFLGKVTNSPYSITWTNAHRGHYEIFARAVDVIGKSAISAPVDITVSNITPVVTITSPTNGIVLTNGSTISVQATATDAASPIASVSFYANEHLIGTATTSPYSVNWTNIKQGHYRLKAVATDQAGVKGSAQPVAVKVNL